MVSTSSRMFEKLRDKRYRDAFVASQIRRLIPKQLRAIRAAQDMTQQELAEAAHTTQTVISRIEKGGGSGNLTIKSLLNLASALDVALVVRFEPIDRHMNWTDSFSTSDVSLRRSSDILESMQTDTDAAKAGARRARTPNTAQIPFDFGSGTGVMEIERPSPSPGTAGVVLEFKQRPMTPERTSGDATLMPLTGTHG